MDLSLCVVNTNGREHLLRCLASIRDNLPADGDAEVLVLDNGSDDGSVAAVAAWNRGPDGLGELAAGDRAGTTGQARRRTTRCCCARPRGELCLLLNEDSELRPGAIEALVLALAGDPRAAVAGAQLLGPDGTPSACAWRLPGVGTALAQALFLHRLLVTQSGRGPEVRRGRLGAVLGDARPPQGRRCGRLPRPGVLRLLGRDGLPEAADRRRLVDPPRARGARGPSRAADLRPLGRASAAWSSSTATATCTCESTTARSLRSPCAC